MQWRGGYKGSAGERSIQRDGQAMPFLPLSQVFWHQMKVRFYWHGSWNGQLLHHTFAVPVGCGLLVVVAAQGRAFVLHLVDFEAGQNLLQVLHNVWEGRTQFRVHLGRGGKRTIVGASTSISTVLNKWLIKGMWLNCFMALSILYSCLEVYSADRKDFLIRMYSKEIEHYAEVRWT